MSVHISSTHIVFNQPIKCTIMIKNHETVVGRMLTAPEVTGPTLFLRHDYGTNKCTININQEEQNEF